MKRRFGVFTTLMKDPQDPQVLILRVFGGEWRWVGMALLAYGVTGIVRELIGADHHGPLVILAVILSLVMVPWKRVEIRKAEGRVVVRTGFYLPFVGEKWTSEETFSLAGFRQASVSLDKDPFGEAGKPGHVASPTWVTSLTGPEADKKIVLASFTWRRTAEAFASAVNEAMGFRGD